MVIIVVIVDSQQEQQEEEPHFQLFTLSLSYSLPLLFFGKFLDTNTKTTTTNNNRSTDPRSTDPRSPIQHPTDRQP